MHSMTYYVVRAMCRAVVWTALALLILWGAQLMIVLMWGAFGG